jgi:hypothetical protein
MTYRAMFPGKLIELNASTGAYGTKGAVIARVMWTDACDQRGNTALRNDELLGKSSMKRLLREFGAQA